MTGLPSTIKRLRKAKGLTQSNLAEIVGVKFQSVQKWESGDSRPSSDKLPALANALGISVDELVNTNLNERVQGVILTDNVASIRPSSSISYVQIPFLSAKAQADPSKMIVENSSLNLTETYPVYAPHITLGEKHITIELVGDSMEPEIKNGAIILAERIGEADMKYETGGVYAVFYANRFAIRRIKTNEIGQSGTLTLWSDNERYGHITIDSKDIISMWKVLAKVHEPVR